MTETDTIKEEEIQTDLLEDIRQEELEKEIEERLKNEERAREEALEELDEEIINKQNECKHEFQIENIRQTDNSYIWSTISCSKCGIKFEGANFRKWQKT